MENIFVNKSDYNYDYYPDNKTNILLTFFWIGFIIYTLIDTISVSGYIKNVIFLQIFQLFGMILFVPTAISLIRFEFDNKYLILIFVIYCCWQTSVILRGILFDIESIKTMLFDGALGILPYFAPLILLFPKNVVYFKKIFTVITVLGVFYIVYDILVLNTLLYPYGQNKLSQEIVEYFSRNLSIPSGFLLLTYIYHYNKRNLFSLFLIFLTFIFAAIRARRGLMFMSVSVLIVSYVVFYFTNRGKIIKVVFSIFLVLSIILYGAYIYRAQRNGIFGLVTSRMHEDTRSGVEEYFYRDMKIKDWLIGRGNNGQYFCPGIDEGHRITAFRSVIETGYLQIILKGGIISLGLFLLILIPAIFKGIFYSNNLLSKAAGIWLFWFLLNLYAAIGNFFNLNYFLVWISIGICYNSSIRSKSDEEVINELQ